MKSISIPEKAPQAIREIIKRDKLTDVTIETGNENIYILKEHKFIVTKRFLANIVNVFNNCNTLRTINMEKFDFSEITTMSWWFSDCENLKEIIFPKYANCVKLKRLNSCFANTNLKIIDLSFMTCNEKIEFISTFHRSKSINITLPKCYVKDFRRCFFECQKLKEIIAPVHTNLHIENIFLETFKDCINLKFVNFDNGNFNNIEFVNIVQDKYTSNNIPDDCVVILP